MGADLAALATAIRDDHRLAEQHAAAAILHAMAAGDRLIQAKAILPHGAWLPWLADSCDLGERRAQRYMHLAAHRAALEAQATRVSDLSIRQATALLATPRPASTAARVPVGSESTPSVPDSLTRSADAGRIESAPVPIRDSLPTPRLPVGRYAAILADPPWRYETWTAAGTGRSAEQHYQTQSTDWIAALPVQDLAADDCMLFLWVTFPLLFEAERVIETWGFTYKTAAFTWMKTTLGSGGSFAPKLHFGMGYWTRSNAEVCLLATRGSPRRLAMDVSSAILAPVREHSRKPEEQYARIERLVAGPYLELFARQPRPGWTAWGNEVDSGSAAADD